MKRLLVFAVAVLAAATIAATGCSLVGSESTPYDDHAELKGGGDL
jgi:hypothetical protein